MSPAQVVKSGISNKTSQLLSRIDYRVIETGEDRDEVFRLRYDAYVRDGFISPNYRKRFSDDFDDSANGRIFGIYMDDELVSSIRIHVATTDEPDCPSFKAFSDIIEPELLAGRTIIDPTRFVTNRNVSRHQMTLPYPALRLCWMAAQHFRADHFFAAVRSDHQAFYKRTFRHRAVCPPRAYAMLNCPISLMTVNYREVEDWVHARYPFFRSSLFERRMLFGAANGVGTGLSAPPVTALDRFTSEQHSVSRS